MTDDNKSSKWKAHFKKHRMNYAILGSFLFSLLVFLFVKPSYTFFHSGRPNVALIDENYSALYGPQVVIMNKCYPVLIFLAAASALACLVLAYIKKNYPLAGALFLIFLPLCFGGYVINGIAPWLEFGSVIDSKDNKYSFLDSSFLQGQTLAIGKMQWDNIFVRKYQILVSTNGDSPRSYIFVVRPEGAKNSYGQMYFANNEWLLGIRSSNELYMAYNLKSGKAYGHTEIGGVSPFLMINRDTKINKGDYSPGSYLTDYVNKDIQLKQIRHALNHPNADIRCLAGQIIKKQK